VKTKESHKNVHTHIKVKTTMQNVILLNLKSMTTSSCQRTIVNKQRIQHSEIL